MVQERQDDYEHSELEGTLTRGREEDSADN